IFAFAQHVDTGNFDFDDSAVVLLDELSGMVPGFFNYRFNLNQFAIHPSSSKIELVGTALGNIATHEVGHNLGSYHSLVGADTGNIMGRGTPWGFDLPGAGPDGVFGNHDDVDKRFRTDPFSQAENEPFGGVGVNDTLNNTAFGLSTGQVAIDQATALWAAAVDLLMADQQTEQTSSSLSSQDLAELATLYLYSDL
ncbi:MAG: zinc metalloprotease, partial [Planctomycetota bacterium]